MPFLTAISICLVLLVGLGLLERFLRDRAWKAVPIRIHVNGTRGKSSVTRLIWAALCEAGIPAVAKTTGAAPRLLLPDGTERPVNRHGKPNIREQLRTLLLARRLGARAVVLECMALAPELQWIAEHSMARATVGVITNARTDHTEIMGADLEQIAACLANTIPFRGTLVVGDLKLADFYARCATERGTKLVVADDRVDLSWRAENEAIALAVTRQFGIADAVALAGMRRAPVDPGDSCQRTADCGGNPVTIVDARSANDPESFLRTVKTFMPDLKNQNAETKSPVLVFNHRSDRPERLRAFATTAFPEFPASRILVTGDHPAFTLWLALNRRKLVAPLEFIASRQLPDCLATLAPQSGGVVFCGNIHGLDLSVIFKTQAHG
jgi:poly-gamma-glutamate synthase PgsB/CapB